MLKRQTVQMLWVKHVKKKVQMLEVKHEKTNSTNVVSKRCFKDNSTNVCVKHV